MNDFPDVLVNKISDYLLPSEFLKFSITSKNIHRICNKKKHIFLYNYFHLEKFFIIPDKTKLLSIETLSTIVHSDQYTHWLFYIIKTDNLMKCEIVWRVVWKVVTSRYYITTYCPTSYDHKCIVSRSRYFRDLIQQMRFSR